MIRRTAPVYVFKRKMGKSTSTTSKTDGPMELSFEKLIEKISDSQPMKIQRQHYDKTEQQRFEEFMEEEDARTDHGERQTASFQDLERKPRFEKIYDPDVMRRTSVSSEYLYPDRGPNFDDDRRYRFYVRCVSAAVATILLLIFARFYIRRQDRIYAEIRKKQAAEILAAGEKAKLSPQPSAPPSLPFTQPMVKTDDVPTTA